MRPCFLVALGFLTTASGVQAQSFLGKDATAWIADLDKGEEGARRNAAFALGKLAARKAVPALTTRIREDKSAKVRDAAAFALGEIGQHNKAIADAGLVKALTDALKDGNSLVRRSAAFALGNLGKNAAPSLVALENAVSDAEPEVRQNAAWALGQIGEEGIPGIRKALGDADTLVKRDAAAALAPLAEKSFKAIRPSLEQLLKLCDKGEHVEVRKAAVGVLVKVVGPEDKKVALDRLRQVLNDPDPEVSFNAALALSNIGGDEVAAAIPVLLESARKAAPELRRLAVASFRNIGVKGLSDNVVADLVKELISCLSDPDPIIREKAALSLGGLGAKAAPAVGPLVQMLANPKEGSDARLEAAVSLFGIGEVPAAVEAVPSLIKIVGDPSQDPRVRFRVLWALRVHKGKLRTMEGIYPALTKAMVEPPTPDNKMLRYDCAYLLGVLQKDGVQKETMNVLLEYIKDNTIEEFDSKTSSVGGASQEGGTGQASSKEQGKGDGRKLALQALKLVGQARIAERRDVVMQLRLLAKDPNTTDEVRESSKELLNGIN